MFQGNAEEAMNHYISIIEDSEITSITRYGPNQPGAEGSVMHATFSLKGQTFMCIDSNVKHDFTFTPSFSIYLTCESEAEIDKVYGALIDGGGAMMPLDNYGFSQNSAGSRTSSAYPGDLICRMKRNITQSIH